MSIQPGYYLWGVSTRLRGPLLSAALSIALSAAVLAQASANIITPPGTSVAGVIAEIASQGTLSITGDIFSQGTRVLNGPWAGEIYSQGMMMPNGEVYSQGMQITIPWEKTYPEPLGQGCADAASNCTGNTNWPPTSDPADNQSADNQSKDHRLASSSDGSPNAGSEMPAEGGPAGGSPSASTDLSGNGGDGTPGSSGSASSGPALAPSTGDSSNPGSIPEITTLVLSDPPLVSPAGDSSNASVDPIPEPASVALFGPALLWFGWMLRRRDQASARPAFGYS